MPLPPCPAKLLAMRQSSKFGECYITAAYAKLPEEVIMRTGPRGPKFTEGLLIRRLVAHRGISCRSWATVLIRPQPTLTLCGTMMIAPSLMRPTSDKASARALVQLCKPSGVI